MNGPATRAKSGSMVCRFSHAKGAGKTRVDEAELCDATRGVGWRNCPRRSIGRCIRSRKKPRNLKFFFLIAILVVLVLASRTAISYWVDLLWFRSLGYGEVFWKTRGLEWGVFAGFAAATFVVLLGAFYSAEARASRRPADDAHG